MDIDRRAFNSLTLAAAIAVAGVASAQDAAPSVQPSRFVGTWVGTQSWAIPNAPPGSRQDQPVTLTIEEVGGRLVGTMTPFLGGDDGATLIEAAIVGEELRATAVVGRPRAGGRGGGFKDATRIAFVFRLEGLSGLDLKGTADVKMGDTPWMKYAYTLSKKRSRY